MLVRYLDERRPALDYNTLATLTGELAGTFWADIERHHPGIDALRLPDEIARAWKERARVITAADGTIRERKNIHALLMRVRAFYLDIQQWALALAFSVNSGLGVIRFACRGDLGFYGLMPGGGRCGGAPGGCGACRVARLCGIRD